MQYLVHEDGPMRKGGAYFRVAAFAPEPFSATDEDPLLNRALTISQLGRAAVPVVFAFGLAPAVFVAAHFYTLIRYDMLTENVRQFRKNLTSMVASEADRERCRQLLANVEFVNALGHWQVNCAFGTWAVGGQGYRDGI
jgi:hypothetical protein